MFLRESGHYKTSYRADMALFPHPAVRRTVWAALFLLFVPVPLFGGEHLLAVLTLNAINLVGALGLTILLGYAGQISLGHGAFMSVGAYTAANLAVRLDMPFWLTLPAGAALAALIGIVVGLPSLRIRGFYLAIATLAAQLVIEWIINRTPAISGGIQASIHVPRPELFGLRLDSAAELYLFVMAVAVAGLLAALNLGRSRLGRAMVAVREHETAASLMGVDTARVKLAAFALSAAYGGVAGVLFTYYLGVANYQQYTFAISIYYLAVNIIGGLGSVWGALLGLAFLSLVPRFVFLAMTTAGVLVRGPRLYGAGGGAGAPDDLRRPDPRLPGAGAGGPGRALAARAQPAPRLALLLLSPANPHFSSGSWSARRCRAGRVGEPRSAMRGIGQAARRTMPARQRRPSGRAQASARGVAGLKRRLRYAFRPTPCGANAWTRRRP